MYGTSYERVLATVLVLAVVGSAAVTITIDPNTRFQTMVGLGGSCKTARQADADALVQDCGVSVDRLDWCEAVESINDSKCINTAGVNNIIGSCWSPPANMKDNGSLVNGGHLLPAQYGAFVDFTIAQLKKFKSTYGRELYSLCIQNEPSFAEFYGSCQYDANTMKAVVALLGPRLKAEGLKTTLHLPDEVVDNFGSIRGYAMTILGDTATAKYIQAISFHSYAIDGISSPTQMKAAALQSLARLVKTYKKELWMTEGGNDGIDYGGAVISCLRYGNISLWTKYDIIYDGNVTTGYFIANSAKQPLYYYAKCIQKFIRPGAIQINSVSSDSLAFTSFVSFYDPAASALVMSFATSGAQAINLQGPSMPATMQMWVANPSVQCVRQADVATNGTVNLPGGSIVTLYGTGYHPPIVGVAKAPASLSKHSAGGLFHMYDLTGRRIAGNAAAAGVQNVRITVSNGRAQVGVARKF